MKNKTNLLIFLIIYSAVCYSQVDSTLLKNTELKLMKHFTSLSVIKNDKKQNLINDSIINCFKKLLPLDQSLNYRFDSLKNMGKLNSSDKKLRLYTWNIPYEDGTHKISGILQYKMKNDSILYWILNDIALTTENEENNIMTPKNWYGAMYYNIIEKIINKQVYYFLIGYNPNNLFSNKKIIDVLYFNEDSNPFFGKPFFNINNRLQNRVVFEYNEKAVMSLHYNKKKKMIIFHHLEPIDQKYKNNPVFFGPTFTFDGFIFKNDVWNFVEDVDVRNENY